MYILFSWCQEDGVLRVFGMIKTILSLIRWIVPIGLIVMTTMDVAKNVINPDDKDSKKKMLNRLIAAVVVFLIPTFINIVMKLVDIGLGDGAGYEYNISDCWKNAR